MLVLELHPGVRYQGHHRLIVDDNLAAARALDHLTGSLIHDLGGEVLGPAGGAVQVAALQTRHHRLGLGPTANLALKDLCRLVDLLLGQDDSLRLLEWGNHLSLLEHGVLVVAVETLHQALLVPLEVVQQDSDCRGGNLVLYHRAHLLNTFHHVIDNLLSR